MGFHALDERLQQRDRKSSSVGSWFSYAHMAGNVCDQNAPGTSGGQGKTAAFVELMVSFGKSPLQNRHDIM